MPRHMPGGSCGVTRGRCSQVKLRARHVTTTVCTSSSNAEPVAPLASYNARHRTRELTSTYCGTAC